MDILWRKYTFSYSFFFKNKVAMYVCYTYINVLYRLQFTNVYNNSAENKFLFFFIKYKYNFQTTSKLKWVGTDIEKERCNPFDDKLMIHKLSVHRHIVLIWQINRWFFPILQNLSNFQNRNEMANWIYWLTINIIFLI